MTSAFYLCYFTIVYILRLSMDLYSFISLNESRGLVRGLFSGANVICFTMYLLGIFFLLSLLILLLREY